MASMETQRWTAAQRDAIGLRDRRLLVSAGAGTGKTSVLVERIRRRVLDPDDPVDVDRLLVLTFTEAAAAEMRERIGRSLEAESARDPANPRPRQQLALLGRSQISTLHAFCLRLIRQYFYRLDLDPAARVLSAHEAGLLEQEVTDALFEELHEEGDEGFLTLVDRYGGRGDEGVRELVLDLHALAYGHPWPERWLDALAAPFEHPESVESTPWFEPLRGLAQRTLAGASRHLAAVQRAAEDAGDAGLASFLRGEHNQLSQAAEAVPAADWADLRALLAGLTWARLPSTGDLPRDTADRIKKARNEAKDACRKLLGRVLDRDEAQVLSELSELRPAMAALVELVKRYDRALDAEKRSLGVIDFRDMERHAFRLLLDPSAGPGELVPSDIARELRAQFAEVLVDEYQDINELQDAIVRLVSRSPEDAFGPANLFMVGDVKQSIYRFRLAEPGLFLARYRESAPVRDEAGRVQDDARLRVELVENFRSRPVILAAVNGVFRQLMTEDLGGLRYRDVAELVPGRSDETTSPDDDPPAEVHLVEKATPEGEADQSAWADYSATEREASVLGQRIRALVEGDGERGPLRIWDAAAEVDREARYRDVAVLMRATKNRAHIVQQTLEDLGVPVYAAAAGGYFDSLEVEIVLALLELIDNPRQDIPMATVLRSPVVGLSAHDLATIRAWCPEEDFHRAVVIAGREGPDELRAQLSDFLDRLEAWRTRARREPLGRLIDRIYRETSLVGYMAAMPGGAQRRANLLALKDRARDFDRFVRQGLFRFLRYIKRLRERGEDLSTPSTLGEDEDVVRLMSIHQAKGLEYPIVVVAGLGTPFQTDGGDLLIDRSLGLGPKHVDMELRVKYPSMAYHAVREEARLEGLAEELRILYVALTRARERLVLLGSAAGLPSQALRWRLAVDHRDVELPATALAGANNALDWLGPALLRHPDAAPLRALATSEDAEDSDRVPLMDHPSRWTVRVWADEALASVVPTDTIEGPEALDWERIGRAEPLGVDGHSDAVEDAERRLLWRYPYERLVGLVAKRSVTELRAMLDPEKAQAPLPDELRERLQRRPRFVQPQTAEDSRRGALRGTAMHRVMQHIDLTTGHEPDAVRQEIGRLVGQDLLTVEEAELVPVDEIAAFFQSELGRRLQGADTVQREALFTMRLPAAEVEPLIASEPGAEDEGIVVQGMADCLFKEEGEWILIDYKSDRLWGESLTERAERYRLPMALYARAVEAAMDEAVREAYLYFFAAGAVVQIR